LHVAQGAGEEGVVDDCLDGGVAEVAGGEVADVVAFEVEERLVAVDVDRGLWVFRAFLPGECRQLAGQQGTKTGAQDHHPCLPTRPIAPCFRLLPGKRFRLAYLLEPKSGAPLRFYERED
jgi:hypothetical protein